MTYVLATIVATIVYGVGSAVIGLLVVPFLRPIAGLIGKIASAGAIAQKKLQGEEARLYEFTGMNFFLMLMEFAVYAGLARLVTTRFAIWPWPIYVVAVLLSLNYWINVAGKLPAWRG